MATKTKQQETAVEDQVKLLEPFAVQFQDGYYAVLQCKSKEHCRERIANEHPDRVVESVRKL